MSNIAGSHPRRRRKSEEGDLRGLYRTLSDSPTTAKLSRRCTRAHQILVLTKWRMTLDP